MLFRSVCQRSPDRRFEPARTERPEQPHIGTVCSSQTNPQRILRRESISSSFRADDVVLHLQDHLFRRETTNRRRDIQQTPVDDPFAARIRSVTGRGDALPTPPSERIRLLFTTGERIAMPGRFAKSECEVQVPRMSRTAVIPDPIRDHSRDARDARALRYLAHE